VHELALADAIVDVAARHAGGRRVTSVRVRVGALRQVVADSLEFSFGLVAAGTPVEGAELEIEHVPTRVACRACGRASELAELPLACARCGSVNVDVLAGEEFYVESIEVDDLEPALRR
jgi:hydrogenase nickel incorporation protein HypA/HybF